MTCVKGCQIVLSVQWVLLSLNLQCRAPSSSSSSALPLVWIGAWTASAGHCSTLYQRREASWRLSVSCDQSWLPLCSGEASSASLAPSVWGTLGAKARSLDVLRHQRSPPEDLPGAKEARHLYEHFLCLKYPDSLWRSDLVLLPLAVPWPLTEQSCSLPAGLIPEV